MQVSKLTIENFRGVSKAELHFSGHTLLIGGNNVGKSTICEALDLALGPDRLYRNPPVEEFDFRNANYLSSDGSTVPIRIEVVLTNLTEDTTRQCAANLEFWHKGEKRLLAEGEIDAVDSASVEFCLRLVTIGSYNVEEDQFEAKTIYGHSDEPEEDRRNIPNRIKRSFGFLYLRTLRTGSKALSLERGSLLDTILRLKELRTGLWERIRTRLVNLDPPIDADATELGPVLDEIESRLAEYIAPSAGEERSTRLFVSQLTREHLRKTIAFFLSMCEGESPVPFQEVGTGTLNILVLALLTFIADIKKDNVIFAMEEPEIALPPHTQRRIVNYLLTETTQCFITSHSPYVIERFEPEGVIRLTRDAQGVLTATAIALPANMRAKTYRSQLRRMIAEAMLGQGAIIGEGITEQLALTASARKMEEADPALFPLDLAGITVLNTEGDGNLEAIGGFFNAIGIPAFAFFDKKARTDDEIQNIANAFTLAKEIPFKGAEALVAAETPLDRQWEFLETIRAEDTDGNFGIPASRPNSDRVRDLTIATLKGLKGEGGAARLLELCSLEELPVTITDFLRDIYSRYPKPKRRDSAAEIAASAPETGSESESTQAAAGDTERP